LVANVTDVAGFVLEGERRSMRPNLQALNNRQIPDDFICQPVGEIITICSALRF
jgi:hypothetical protein